MNSKRIIALTISLLAVIASTRGQEYIDRNHKPSPLTPEAASLARMVNYPINYNTGLPEIKIPLYEIKTGGMSLPIELTYHSGGFKISTRQNNTKNNRDGHVN